MWGRGGLVTPPSPRRGSALVAGMRTAPSLPPCGAGAQHVVLQSWGREIADAQCRREGHRAQCPRLWPEAQLLIRNAVREEAEHRSKS